MATAYTAIAANKRRSVVLLAVFILVVVTIGWTVSRLLEAGPAGIFFALIFAVGASLGGYYGGDALALSLARAEGPIRKEDSPYLWNLVENLCIATGVPMPKLYILPEAGVNAFATGRDPMHASIAVTRGAIEKLENEELEGVLAHELSHIKNYDVRFMTLVAVLVGFIAILSDFAMRSMWFGGGRRSSSREGSGAQGIFLVLGIVLLILAPLVGQLIKFAVSRRREFLADADGALMTRYPEGLARALEKIGADSGQKLSHAASATAHLYFSNPFGAAARGVSTLFQTHPPLQERIDALRRMG